MSAVGAAAFAQEQKGIFGAVCRAFLWLMEELRCHRCQQGGFFLAGTAVEGVQPSVSGFTHEQENQIVNTLLKAHAEHGERFTLSRAFVTAGRGQKVTAENSLGGCVTRRIFNPLLHRSEPMFLCTFCSLVI